jgi:uncharacterized membrane protein SirB2
MELLRVLCVISIIAGHVLYQTDAGELQYTDGFDYYFLLFVSNGVRLVINCFVMIGAWFLVDIKFQAKRIVNLWLEIFFYSVILDSVCLIFGVGDPSIVWEVQAFFPIMGRPIWFGAEYICMLFISPFMNQLLHQQRQIAKKLIFLVGMGIIVCATVFPIEHTAPVFSELVWFCFLYLFVGYIKLYRQDVLSYRARYICGALGSWILLCVIRLIGAASGISMLSSVASYYYLHYESLIGFVCSFCLFCVFLHIDIGTNKVINWLSASVFAVYLIHQTWAFYPFLWNGIYHVNEYVWSGKFSMYLIFLEVSLFLACAIIDSVRRWLFAKTIYRCKIYQKVCEKIDKYIRN